MRYGLVEASLCCRCQCCQVALVVATVHGALMILVVGPIFICPLYVIRS